MYLQGWDGLRELEEAPGNETCSCSSGRGINEGLCFCQSCWVVRLLEMVKIIFAQFFPPTPSTRILSFLEQPLANPPFANAPSAELADGSSIP